jgi:hypothetical protein
MHSVSAEPISGSESGPLRPTRQPEHPVRRSESAELRERAASHAACSALIPGAGQLLQGRFGAAVVQFGTVAAYAAAAIASGNPRALWIAVAWNVWSAVDAYRQERD